MRAAFFTTIASLLFLSGYSYAQGRPQLTSEQRTCLESRIGQPGSGNRPSREQMEAAFSACGIQAPKHGGPRGGFGHNLTDEQKTCLEGRIGKPGSGTRPSREQMDSAFSACGIERPERPAAVSGDSFDSLKARFSAAQSDEEKEADRESIRRLFYASDDENLRAQIRDFFKENPQAITWSTPAVEARASKGVR